MKALTLPVAIALAATLAACDSTGTNASRSGGGVFGSSSAPAVTTASPAQTRAIERACNPGNVSSDQRASVLHQDRPGGSDCPDAVTTPRR